MKQKVRGMGLARGRMGLAWMMAVVAVPLLGGCGGGGGGSSSSSGSSSSAVTYAYVADFGSKSISRYTVSPSGGALTAAAGSSVGTGGSPSALAITPDGRFVYATDEDTNTILGYAVNAATGALTPIGSTSGAGTLPNGEAGLYGITVSPSGKFAYAASYYANTVSVYAIDPATGALTAVPGGVVGSGRFPDGLALSADGRFAYVTNAFDRTVSQYAVDGSTGLLTPTAAGPVSVSGSPTGIAVGPGGKFAYVTSQTPQPPGAILVYAVNSATGALTLLGTSPSVDAQPSVIAFGPNGAAYVANTTSLSEYTVNGSSGALTLLPQDGTPSVVGAGIVFATVHP